MWGFIHSTFLTTPVTLIGLLTSNCADSEWCAISGTVIVSKLTVVVIKARILRVIVTSSASGPYFFCASDSTQCPPLHLSFSLQTYSRRSQVGCSTIWNCSVHGFVQILGSSIV